jgi:hypothetical protein
MIRTRAAAPVAARFFWNGEFDFHAAPARRGIAKPGKTAEIGLNNRIVK